MIRTDITFLKICHEHKHFSYTRFLLFTNSMPLTILQTENFTPDLICNTRSMQKPWKHDSRGRGKAYKVGITRAFKSKDKLARITAASAVGESFAAMTLRLHSRHSFLLEFLLVKSSWLSTGRVSWLNNKCVFLSAYISLLGIIYEAASCLWNFSLQEW